MYYINLPIINEVGLTEVREFDSDRLSPGELAVAHSFLDTADYTLGSEDHPNRRTDHTLDEYEGAQVGGYYLQTSQDILEDLVNSGEINPSEDHSSLGASPHAGILLILR